MLSELYDLAPEVWMYGENDADIAREFRILPAEELRPVIAARPAPVLVFKPICDSQRADELLAEHPEARADLALIAATRMSPTRPRPSGTSTRSI